MKSTGGWCWLSHTWFPISFPLRCNSALESPSQKANRRWFPQLQQLVKCLQEYVLFRNNSWTNTRLIKALISHTKNSMHNLKRKQKPYRVQRNSSAKTQIKCRSIQNNIKNQNQKSLWTQRKKITSQIMWPKLPTNLVVAQLGKV